MAAAPMTLGAVLLLLVPWASTQATQCAPDGSSQLRFVAQLSVSGCTLFVHDTGANDGPHLAVEPVMCVMESLHKLAPRYDPVTQQTYVSVPVMLRDDAMLAEVQRQLRHLSPKSVKFATVSDISVSTDATSKFQALGFIWSPEKSVGFLELGCTSLFENSCSCNFSSRMGFETLDQVLLTANIIAYNTTSQLNYRPLLQNRTVFDMEVGRFGNLRNCQKLRFVRSVRLNNCTARVHQRLDMKGHFLIEPLLCHNITSMSNESVMYDSSRDMHYLKLDVVLQDDMAAGAVRTQLADLSPRSVTFMRLRRAQSHVASALSRRFVIGPLMVSDDWRSAQLRVYCSAADECDRLRSTTQAGPINLWKHIRYSVTSLALTDSGPDRCLMKSAFPSHPWSMDVEYGRNLIDSADSVCKGGKWLVLTRGDRKFVVIQQRLTGIVSFQRTWAEYERGFGDQSDFWIGLSTIHALSMNGVTLRVEMKLWDDTVQHAEYAGFKVRAARNNYVMVYREMLSHKSSFRFDGMHHHKGMPFSTMDRDNDGSHASCSDNFGQGGWWFRSCHKSNPNGFYHAGDVEDPRYCSWYLGSGYANLMEVRLMLEI